MDWNQSIVPSHQHGGGTPTRGNASFVPAGVGNMAYGHGASPPELQDETLLSVVWRQRGLVLSCAVLGLALAYAYTMFAPPVYATRARLQVTTRIISPADAQQARPQDGENYLNTQCEVLRSTTVLALALDVPGADEFRTFAGEQNRIAWLKRNLTAEVGKKNDLIDVTLAARYPEEARKLVDAVIDVYIARETRIKKQTATEVMAILQKQKELRDAELRDKTGQLAEFQRAYDTTSMEPGRGEGGAVNVGRQQQMLAAVDKAHEDAQAAGRAFREACAIAGLDPRIAATQPGDGVAVSNDSVEALRAALFAWKTQLDTLKNQYLPNHPSVLGAAARVEQYRNALVAAARSRWLAAQDHEVDATKSHDEQVARTRELILKAGEYGRLIGDVKRLQDISAALDTQVKQVSLAGDAGALNIEVLDRAATDDDRLSPNKPRALAIGLVAGLLLGVMLGLVREWVDPRLSGAEEMRAALGINVIGMVPRVPGNISPETTGWAVHLNPDSEVAEAVRSVRAAITLNPRGGHGKTVLVTSPTPGDGKTMVASNLAIAMAKVGKRVLLVDCNFRNPCIHRIFGVNDEMGFTGVLAGVDPIERAVKPTAIDRLDVLPAGDVPRDPTELLNSQTFAMVLEGLATAYDHVVLDAPPATGVSDARIVAASCDATVLVLRADNANRRSAELARDGLLSVGATLLGIVINDVKPSGRNAGGSGYHPTTGAVTSYGRVTSSSGGAGKPPMGPGGMLSQDVA